MAKASQIFTGNSSYGVPENYAMREDGVWFSRHYAFNGYGMGFTKWMKCQQQNLSDYIVGDKMMYGFNPLRRGNHARIRLPD